MGALDDYFGTLDATTRAAFEHIRQVAMDLAPTAEQGTSYGAPALKHEGKPLLGFRVSKQHLSIFPFSASAVDAIRERSRELDLSEGTIRFTAGKPPPDDVVDEMIRARIAEIERR